MIGCGVLAWAKFCRSALFTYPVFRVFTCVLVCSRCKGQRPRGEPSQQLSRQRPFTWERQFIRFMYRLSLRIRDKSVHTLRTEQSQNFRGSSALPDRTERLCRSPTKGGLAGSWDKEEFTSLFCKFFIQIRRPYRCERVNGKRTMYHGERPSCQAREATNPVTRELFFTAYRGM